MKRLALPLILGLVAFGLASQVHRPHPHRPALRPAIHLASFSPDEPPAPPRPPAGPRAKHRRVEPAPAPAPAAEAASKRQPDWFPRDHDEEVALAKPDARGVRVLVGPLSADEGKARKALRLKIYEEVNAWLSGDVAPGWEPEQSSIDRMTMATYVQPVTESLGDVSKDLDDLYTLHRAGARLDFSPDRRADILASYEDDLVRDRMTKGGALFAFVLFVLAVLAGYIRADESTKGYYTNRLRMLAAAGVGAAGVVVYRMIA